MMQPRFILFSCLFMLCAYQAYGMQCPLALGMEISCPTAFDDEDKVFCCNNPDKVSICCDIGDYISDNSAIIAGIIVGGIILLVICTVCCCCFCSCCLLAKRRVQRGTVYGPVAPAPVVSPGIVSPPLYSHTSYSVQPTLLVHTPPNASNPPPYPLVDCQPPVNPNYKG